MSIASTSDSCQWLRVACVGDSLTRGDGLHEHPPHHRVPFSRLRLQQRPLRVRGNYPSVLQRLLGRRADVRNFGHGGSTACNLSAGRGPPFLSVREFPAALQFEPHVVILMLGTNDAKGHLWRHGVGLGPCSDAKRGFRRGLADIIGAFAALPTPPQLLMMVAPPPLLSETPMFGIERALLADVRTAVADLASSLQAELAATRTHVMLAPALPIASDDASLFADDQLHLNANGTAQLACALHQSIGSRRWAALLRSVELAGAVRRPSFESCRHKTSCFEPFCPTPPADDYHARRCYEETGFGAPALITGLACHTPAPGRTADLARATCSALRRRHGGVDVDEEAEEQSPQRVPFYAPRQPLHAQSNSQTKALKPSSAAATSGTLSSSNVRVVELPVLLGVGSASAGGLYLLLRRLVARNRSRPPPPHQR